MSMSPQLLKSSRATSGWKKWHITKKYATKINRINKNKRKHNPPIAFPGLDSKRSFVYNFLWVLLIFFSAFACSFQTYDRFSFFLSRPIDTKVRLIRNSSVKFPSITLCPFFNNYMTLVGVRYQKAVKKKLQHFCLVNPLNLINDSLNVSTIWDHMSLNGTLLSASEFSRSDLFNKAALTNSPLFSVKTDTKTVFGTCNTYSFKNLVPFKRDDFVLVFRFNDKSNLHLCEQSIITMFVLHDDDDTATYKTFIESKSLSPINKAMYGLSAKRFKVLNRTENSCDTNQVVKDCEKNCFEITLKNISRCRLPLTSVSATPLCSNESDALVAYDQLLQLSSNFNYLKRCNCPEICDQILYTDHLKLIEKSDQSWLLIYFEDNVIEEIEEYYSYSLVSLLCDVGGNLGLFLGLSIPAIFQLGESVVVYAIKRIHSTTNF